MNKILSITVLLTAILTGCNSNSPVSGTPSEVETETPQSSDPAQQGQHLNGGLPGHLIVSMSGRSLKIDLASGSATDLPFNDIAEVIENNPELSFGSDANTITASDQSANAAFVQTYSDCISVNSSQTRNFCYMVYDSDLSKLIERPRVSYSTQLDSGLRLSRSQQYLLTNDYNRTHPNHGDYDDYHLLISAVASGEAVRTIAIRDANSVIRNGPIAAEWGYDDEVIFTDVIDQPPVIYITRPISTEIARKITLPSRFKGTVTNMFLSPDGNQLLFTYSRGHPGSGSFPMILDLNALNVRIPAVPELDADNIPLGDLSGSSSLLAEGWSPDGRWILVQEPTRGLAVTWSTVIPTSGTYNTFAVPADGVEQVVSTNPALASASVIRLRFRDPLEPDTVIAFEGPRRSFAWIE